MVDNLDIFLEDFIDNTLHPHHLLSKNEEELLSILRMMIDDKLRYMEKYEFNRSEIYRIKQEDDPK